jgi:hypothetical protein
MMRKPKKTLRRLINERIRPEIEYIKERHRYAILSREKAAQRLGLLFIQMVNKATYEGGDNPPTPIKECCWDLRSKGRLTWGSGED